MMVQAAIVAANAAILLRGKVELVLLIAKEKKRYSTNTYWKPAPIMPAPTPSLLTQVSIRRRRKACRSR